MSRCPKLEYESHNFWGNSDDKYVCTVTGMKMDVNHPKVKTVCDCYGDCYRDCEIYKIGY